MRYIVAFSAFVFSLGICIAATPDEELAAAIVHYESIVYSSVANSVSSEVESANLTDEQATEWIEAISNQLAVCDLDALTYLGSDVREESIYALANGSGKEAISQIVSKKLEANPNFKAVVLEYTDARRRCIVMVNQEFGIDYY